MGNYLGNRDAGNAGDDDDDYDASRTAFGVDEENEEANEEVEVDERLCAGFIILKEFWHSEGSSRPSKVPTFFIFFNKVGFFILILGILTPNLNCFI